MNSGKPISNIVFKRITVLAAIIFALLWRYMVKEGGGLYALLLQLKVNFSEAEAMAILFLIMFAVYLAVIFLVALYAKLGPEGQLTLKQLSYLISGPGTFKERNEKNARELEAFYKQHSEIESDNSVIGWALITVGIVMGLVASIIVEAVFTSGEVNKYQATAVLSSIAFFVIGVVLLVKKE